MGKKARRRAGGAGLRGLYESLARAEARVKRLVDSIRAIEGRSVVVVRGRRKARPSPAVPRGDGLVEALVRLLKGRSLSVAEAAAGVGGVRGLVGRVLATSPRFRRVSRGRYTSRG
jgi:hypothetical protein